MRQNKPAASDSGDVQKRLPAPRLVRARVQPIKLATLRDLRDELGRLYRQARSGIIQTQDATRLAFVLGQLRELLVVIDIEERLKALEERHNDK